MSVKQVLILQLYPQINHSIGTILELESFEACRVQDNKSVITCGLPISHSVDKFIN